MLELENAVTKNKNSQLASYPPIQELADEIQARFDECEHQIEDFTEIASNALEKYTDYNLLTADKILEWLLFHNFPTQLGRNFGEPPVTLFVCKQFAIDLYFWESLETDIHDHAFAGAFKVVAGKTLDVIYDFKSDSVKQGVRMGHLQVKKILLMDSPDQIECIYPGKSFIHHTVHLCKPTVTLCVRTCGQHAIQQYAYLPIGLALPFTRNYQYDNLVFQLLHMIHYQGESYLRKYIYNLFLSLKSEQQMFTIFFAYINCIDNIETCYDIINYIPDRLADHKDIISEIIRYFSKYNNITQNQLTCEESRLFFQLVKMSSTMEELYQLVDSIRNNQSCSVYISRLISAAKKDNLFYILKNKFNYLTEIE